MKKLLSFLLVGLSSTVYADISGRTNWRSIDGTVSAYPYQAKFSNGQITDNGDGTVTITITAGGGGSSSLATSTGTTLTYNGVPISSPTGYLLFDSRTTNGQLLSANTYFFTLLNTSVTLQGQNVIFLTSSLQSGATLYISSGSINGPLYILGPPGLTVTYGATVGSMTVNGSSAGAVQLTEGQSAATFGSATGKDNFWADTSSHAISANFNSSASTFTIVTSSFTPVANQYLFWVGGGPNGWVVGSTAPAGAGGGGGGSTPGAPVNAVQYNNPLGTFAGSANFTYNGTTLTVANSTVQVNNADASSFNNYSNITYTGFNSFSYAGTSITYDNTSPFTTGSSMTVNGVNGLTVKYGASLGSATVSNLSSGQCVQTGAGGLLTGTGSACSAGGGGGSSTLAASTGTASTYNGIPITSPTAYLLFDSRTTSGQLLSASTYFFTLNNSSVTLLGQTISATNNLGGTIQAAQFPALTGDITTPGGSLATTAAGTQGNITNFSHALTMTSSVTVTAPLGLGVTYNVNVGSMTGGGLATCGDATHGLGFNSSNLFTCQSITGSGGSGIVSPGTFTWVNNLGIQVSTFVAINSNTTPTLQVSTASTGVAQLAVSSIVAVNPTDFLLTVSSTSGTMVFGIQNNSHLISSGTTPTMGSCGSSPSVIGTDNAGTITVGGGVVTTCTLNFASAWGQVPVCVETDNSTTITGDISAISTTAITFSFSASLGGGQIYYICVGSKG